MSGIIVDRQRRKEYTQRLLVQFFEICSRRGYTKKEMAKLVGVYYTGVYRWLRGESLPRSSAILERLVLFVKNNNINENEDVNKLCHNSDKAVEI